ncbi:MAG: poly-beta-1,6-N-acetyl-D-glucosamine N-deacetylase PgaB [Pseudomonadota bacterium]
MMRARVTQKAVQLLALVLAAAFGAAHAQNVDSAVTVRTIGYHDVRDNLARTYDPDQYAVTAEHLAGHFRWLRSQGYTVVSVDDVLTAQAGGKALPDRAVLLSFDDGFASVYTHVYPLLKAFGYPAIVSPVTSWIESSVEIPYNGETLSKENFLTWAQLREMHNSGLVEVASHTHNLHRGITANPQGNELPAGAALAFGEAGYESTVEQRSRLHADLARSAELIEENVGQRPRVITWPYGAWHEAGRLVAAELGMALSLTLDDRAPLTDRGILGRDMPVANPGIALFADMLREARPEPPLRAVQVDLDYVYDPDPAQQEANLGRLLDRILELGVNAVFLQAFADPDGDGSADAVYFPNRHLPMRADLFNRAAWQLRTRTPVSVYAWMPISAFNSPTLPEQWAVLEDRGSGPVRDVGAEPRLSIHVPEAAQWIEEVYEDLAQHARFQGLHFHDDGRRNEFEDANPAARASFQKVKGPGDDAEGAWSRFKTESLISFTEQLERIVRRWQPGLKVSRNLFASALLDPRSERYLAQDYALFLKHYDHVALMAMPAFEGYSNARAFYRNLLIVAEDRDPGLKQTLFQLQAKDWQADRWLSGRTLRKELEFLRAGGAQHLAYYPDDFIGGQPDATELARALSVRETALERVR